ncbi:glycosyltransferase family 2 protein [Telmatospirillum siberiense]|uniref:Glycosyltransferase family 2 protein n=1 Tax=Telmatospirillum siberiense TaxID=382514 RepID=A0A2N3PVM2_9PROT|nr:glycosyltransferase family 2 protein [Telmatospirillum siberiense]
MTVVILTLNEARRLSTCLAAIPQRYPVLVVDCGSTDGTVGIAEADGCKVTTNPWSGFSAQRNFALRQCDITSKWVLFIDADEVFPQKFYDWFETEIKDRDDFDVGQVASILYFKGKPLRYVPAYPMYHPRLVRRGHAHFVPNHTNHGEAANADARELLIDIPYLHDWFDGDLVSWLHKHVKLAAQEANLKSSYDGLPTARAKLSLLFQSALVRVPGRFFFHYFWRGGFRDGRYGFEYAMMYTWFEFTKGLIKLGNGTVKDGK